MLNSAPITDEHFRRLHPIVIEAHVSIPSLLDQLRRERRVLRRAINRRMDPETAILERIDDDVLTLKTEHFEPDDRVYVFLNFELDGVQYFLDQGGKMVEWNKKDMAKVNAIAGDLWQEEVAKLEAKGVPAKKVCDELYNAMKSLGAKPSDIAFGYTPGS